MTAMMNARSIVIGAGVFVLLGVSPASAQSRPFRGLFGGGVGNAQQLLTASGSLGAGFTDNVFAEAANRELESRARRGGTIGNASGALSYSLSLGRIGMGASAGTTVRYYPSLSTELVRSYSASASISSQLLSTPAVGAGQSVQYQPVSLNSLFPVLVETPTGESFVDLDFTPVREHYFAYAGSVSLSHEISPRVSTSAGAGYRLTEGLYDSRFLTYGANASLRIGLTRNLGLRLGYGYSEGRYADSDERYGNHNPTSALATIARFHSRDVRRCRFRPGRRRTPREIVLGFVHQAVPGSTMRSAAPGLRASRTTGEFVSLKRSGNPYSPTP
jgi:hypothetical protein